MKLDVYRIVTFVFGAKFGTIALQFLIAPILIRLLGNQYGDYTFVMSVMAIAVLFMTGGVFDGLRKFLAERSDERWQSDVFGYYVRVSTVATAVIVALVVLAVQTGFVRSVLGEAFDLYFYLLALMLVSREFFIISRSTLLGLGFEHLSEPVYVMQRFLFGLFGIGLAVSGFGVAGVLIGDVLATTVATLVGLVFVARQLRVRRVFARPSTSFPRRQLLGYNSLSVVLSLLFNTLYHVDILLLRPLAGSEATAQYKAALLVAEFLWVIPLAIQNSFVHVTSPMWADEDYDGIDHLASRITRYMLLLNLLLALGIALLAEEFVSLYFGPEFVTIVVPLLVLLPGALGYATVRPLVAIGKGKGDLRVLVYATIGAAVINLVLNALLIPLYGMVGAAVATTIGYGSMLVFHFWGARRIGYQPLNDLRLPRVALTAAVTAPVVYGLNAAIPSDLLSLALVPPAGFLVYATAAIQTGAINRSEIDHIFERLPFPVPRLVRNLVGT